MSSEYFQGEEILRIQGDVQYQVDQVLAQQNDINAFSTEAVTNIDSTTLNAVRAGSTYNINIPSTLPDAYTFSNVVTFQKANAFDRTITAGGTTGNQTINKPAGTVNIAAAATSITVTNSLVTVDSIVLAVVRTNDATAIIKNVVCSSGSFVITLTAAATAETSIGFLVTN